MSDAYYLAHEKLIEEAWNAHFSWEKSKDEFTGMEDYNWGGGRFSSPPF